MKLAMFHQFMRRYFFVIAVMTLGMAVQASAQEKADILGVLNGDESSRITYNVKYQPLSAPGVLNPSAQEHALMSILQSDGFRNDPDIRSALQRLQTHPFTTIRSLAGYALSDESFDRKTLVELKYGTLFPFGEKNINSRRTYCDWPETAQSVQAGDDYYFETGIAKHDRHRVVAYKSEIGWIAANYYSIQGLGLYLYPPNSPRTFLKSGNFNYVGPSDLTDSLWIFTGPTHMGIGGEEILKASLRDGYATLQPHMKIPEAAEAIKRLENGDLFVRFVDINRFKKPDTSEITVENNKLSVHLIYNPPIIFTLDGKVRSACE